MTWQIVITFFALFVTDVAWAFYINKVKNGSPLQSALWATFMFGIGAVGTISYVHNAWLLVPALLGAFVGTYVGVLLNKQS